MRSELIEGSHLIIFRRFPTRPDHPRVVPSRLLSYANDSPLPCRQNETSPDVATTTSVSLQHTFDPLLINIPHFRHGTLHQATLYVFLLEQGGNAKREEGY